MANTSRVEITYAPTYIPSAVATISPTDDASNVSNLDMLVNNTSPSSIKGFHISGDIKRSILDGSYAMYAKEGYSGYCSKSISDAEGSIDLTLTISPKSDDGWGKIPKYLTITFDKLEDAFPTEFIVSNSENTLKIAKINSFRTVCIDLDELHILSTKTKILVKFTKLSEPYSNLKIQQIAFAKAGVYTDNIIKKFRCSEQLLDTTFNINPCVITQYAEIVFKDKYGEFKKLANADALGDNLNVDIYIDNNLIGTYVTDEWSVQAHNTEVTLNCVDPSNVFDRIEVPRLPVQKRTLGDLLQIGFGCATVSWRYIDTETEQYCTSIVQHDSWLAATTLATYFKMVCMLGLIRIYWHINHFIVARCY